MAKQDDPFQLNVPVKHALEQAHHALDIYFDYLKKSVFSLPSGGTELGKTLKQDGVENLAAMQEVLKRLRKAKSFEEALRIQMDLFTRNSTSGAGKQRTSPRYTPSRRRRCEGAIRRKEILKGGRRII